MENNPRRTVYAEKIFKLAKDRVNEVFYNSSPEHAIIVHQALVQNADSYVYIFSSSMCTEVSNNPEYCEIVKRFLSGSEKRKIKIVLTHYEKENFPEKPIAKVLALFPSQVEVRKFDGQVEYKGKPAHFTVSDDRAFRLETNIEDQMAFGNFNSPDQATDLKKVFENVYNSSLTTPVAY